MAALLAVVAWWQIRHPASELEILRSHPIGVMGTHSTLVALSSSGPDNSFLAAPEAELRRLEALLSGWIEASEISALNRARMGEPIALSVEVLEVLTAARRLHEESLGAFDATSGPLIERWRRAGEEGALPTTEDLADARRRSNWLDFEIGVGKVTKGKDSARVDLDGLAKGFAIDRALQALLDAGAVAGMVEVGGDLRVAGRGPEEEAWTIGLRSPFGERAWGTLALRDAAICTSGPYHRWFEIAGRRYSHIVDPRTLQPAEVAVSTTVIAPDALTADGWATALAVLGEAGLARLPDDLEALVVLGSASDYRAVATPGFVELLVGREFELEIFER